MLEETHSAGIRHMLSTLATLLDLVVCGKKLSVLHPTRLETSGHVSEEPPQNHIGWHGRSMVKLNWLASYRFVMFSSRESFVRVPSDY
jgi:hypothetical protein